MRHVAVVSVFIAFCVAAFAQSDRGTITGTISDPAGAVIAGAMIEAKNVATGAVYPTASSDTGNYTIAQLPAGTYELTVTVPGFKKYVRGGLQVEVAANIRIDVGAGSGLRHRIHHRGSCRSVAEDRRGRSKPQRRHRDSGRLADSHPHRRGGQHRNREQPGQYPEPAVRGGTAARRAHLNRCHPARQRHAVQFAIHQHRGPGRHQRVL